jgi:hypothetical protein
VCSRQWWYRALDAGLEARRGTHQVGRVLHDLGAAEVAQFEVAVVRDKQVFWLDVAMDYALRVHVL